MLWRRRKIVKFNPKSTKVRCEEIGWNVSYGLLHRAGRESARNGAERLNGVAGMARRLMDEHGLTGWTLAAGHNSLRPDMPRPPADDGSPSPSAQPLGCTGGIAPSHAEPSPPGPASRHAG